MNMTIEDKCVRIILGAKWSVLATDLLYEDGETKCYAIMARPLRKESVIYKRRLVYLCDHDSFVFKAYLERLAPEKAEQVRRKVAYGLGSWCCSATFLGGVVDLIGISKRMQNRELNQGTY